jgi:DNA repair protein RadC
MIKSFYANKTTLPNNYKSLECAETFRKLWKKGTMDEFESVYIIYLNSKNEQIFTKRLCEGNYSETCFDTRRAIHYALYYKSPSFIIAHNHTNGTPNPSQNDLIFTQMMLTTLEVLQIKLVDHIILTIDDYFSFQDAGFLKIDPLVPYKKVG